MIDEAEHAGGYDVDAVEEATGLGVAIVRIQRQLRARAGSDMTPSQSSALARIEQDGPLRLGALADLEGTTAATMSRVIDSLSDRSLIERVPDPLDGRASLVRLRPEASARNSSLASRLWRWAAVDNLRLNALNAVECALDLRRLRPQGTVQ